MDLYWVLGLSIAVYAIFRRGNWVKFIILILLALGLGLAPRIINLPNVVPSSILVNNLDLAIGVLCSIKVQGILAILGLDCKLLGMVNAVYGKLPIIVAIYDVAAWLINYWQWFWLIGLIAYIWDEDVSLSLILIPYIALIIAIILKPIILTLTSLSILNYSRLYVTYVYSSSLIAYTGETNGYTNDIPLTSTPFNN